MFRLIGMLLMVLVLGFLSVVVLDAINPESRSPKDCPGGTTTSLPVSVPPGVAKLVTPC